MSYQPQNHLSESALLHYRSAAYEQLVDGLIITTPDGRIIDWNLGATRMFGWTRDEMLGLTSAVLHPECEAFALAGSMNEAMLCGEGWRGERVFVRKDGSSGICTTTAIPMRDAVGNIFATLNVNRDITAEKAVEGKLIEEKRLLQTLIDALADPIFFKDSDRRFILVNAAHKRLWNITREEAIGKTDEEIPTLQEHAGLYAVDDEAILRTGESIINREEPFTGANGQDGWFLTSKFPLRDAEGRIVGIVGTCRDVTERHRAAQALADEREKLRTILDAVHDPVFVKDTEGRHVMRNEACVHVFQHAADSMCRTVYEMDIPREHADRYTADDRTVLETGTPVVNREEPFKMPGGGEGTLLTSKFPLRDSSGHIVGLVGIGRDITQIRKDIEEKERLNKQLVDLSRQAGMAEVATSVLHNVGNVLNSVNVSCAVISSMVYKSRVDTVAKAATLLREHASDLASFLAGDPAGQKLPEFLWKVGTKLCKEKESILSELQLLAKNIEHIKEIVAMQQSYANAAGVAEMVDVVDLTEDSLRMNVEAMERHNVRFIREYSKVPPIITEKHKVLQILVNLIRNAKCACVESAHSDRRVTVSVFSDRESVKVQVADNGVGISEENLTRIFNHGFTTRKDGHGFGLHNAVLTAQELGGGLNVHSAGRGAGATFTLELPVRLRKAGA